MGNFFQKLWGGLKKTAPALEVGLNMAGALGVPYVGIAASLLAKFQHATQTAEATITGPGEGKAKALLASATFAESLSGDIATAIFEARGEKLIWDKTLEKKCMDLQVAIYNDSMELKDAIEQLRKSFSTEKIIK